MVFTLEQLQEMLRMGELHGDADVTITHTPADMQRLIEAHQLISQTDFKMSFEELQTLSLAVRGESQKTVFMEIA